VSAAVCEKWFKRFRNDDYDVNDKSHSGLQTRWRTTNWKHCSTKTLKTLRTLKELAGQLGVDKSLDVDESLESNEKDPEGKKMASP